MMKKLILIIFVIIACLAAGQFTYHFFFKSDPLSTNDNAYANMGGDFALKTPFGELTLESFKGQKFISTFGFTHCPDICPLALHKMSSLLTELNEKDISVLFVSVDWKRDTPQSAYDYARDYGENFVGATASQTEIERLAKSYGVYFKFTPIEDSELGYTVDHSSRYFFHNEKGDIVDSISTLAPKEEIKEVLLKYLKRN